MKLRKRQIKRQKTLAEQLMEQFPLMSVPELMALLTLIKCMGGSLIIEGEEKVVVVYDNTVKLAGKIVPSRV